MSFPERRPGVKAALVCGAVVALFAVLGCSDRGNPGNAGAYGAIEGTVVTIFGKGVAWAPVSIEGTPVQARADSSGWFCLYDVPPGGYTLNVAGVFVDVQVAPGDTVLLGEIVALGASANILYLFNARDTSLIALVNGWPQWVVTDVESVLVMGNDGPARVEVSSTRMVYTLSVEKGGRILSAPIPVGKQDTLSFYACRFNSCDRPLGVVVLEDGSMPKTLAQVTTDERILGGLSP